MKNFNCDGVKSFMSCSGFAECPECGNHLCIKAAKRLDFICPHCFARLNKIG